MKRQLQGGGGTDMVAGIDAAMSLRPRPDAVIVLTDGYTPFPHQRYHIPVIFGILSAQAIHCGYRPTKPPMPPWRECDVVVISGYA